MGETHFVTKKNQNNQCYMIRNVLPKVNKVIHGGKKKLKEKK